MSKNSPTQTLQLPGYRRLVFVDHGFLQCAIESACDFRVFQGLSVHLLRCIQQCPLISTSVNVGQREIHLSRRNLEATLISQTNGEIVSRREVIGSAFQQLLNKSPSLFQACLQREKFPRHF